MKHTRLLNRHVSQLIASLGHLDEIVVADAGLPVPSGVAVIDLAVQPGVPLLRDVIDAVRSELAIEAAYIATEAAEGLQAYFADLCREWSEATGKAVDLKSLSHDAFKARTTRARAVIRTGECTPYCNIILVSGVPF